MSLGLRQPEWSLGGGHLETQKTSGESSPECKRETGQQSQTQLWPGGQRGGIWQFNMSGPISTSALGWKSLWRGRAPSHQMALEPGWRLYRNSSHVARQFHCHRIHREQCQEAESLTQSGLQWYFGGGAGVVWSWVSREWWGAMARYICPEDSFTYLWLKGDFLKLCTPFGVKDN